MASDENVKKNRCVYDPNFAVVCSFFENYSSLCGIQPLSFTEFQQMIENMQETAPQLIDLHIRLLRKAKKNVNPDKWERALARFCWANQPDDCWVLEQKGYKHLNSSQRLQLLLNLIGAQFDQNLKFKADINKLDVTALRLEPIGRDKDGHSYWAHMDRDVNIKVYKEDLDEEKWDLIATDREGVVRIIEDLLQGRDPNRKLEEIENDEPSEDEEEILSKDEENELDDDDEYDSETSHSNHAEDDDDDEYGAQPKRESKLLSKVRTTVRKKAVATVINAENCANSIGRPRSKNISTPVALDKKSFAQHLQNMDSHNMLLPLLNMNEPSAENSPPTLSVDSLKSKINQKFSSIKPVDILKTTFESANKSAKPGLKLEQILKSKLAQKLSGNLNSESSAAPKSRAEFPEVSCKSEDDAQIEDVAPEPKNCCIEAMSEDEREIEEPVMVVTGVGNGQDCNCSIEYEFEEEIVEDVMFVIGVGSGAECCTGNEDDNSKTASNSAVLSHKVDDILRSSEEEQNSEPAATVEETSAAADVEKKKPKLWTIDAICSSDSSRDSKRDRESISLFPNYSFNKENKENPKPYCGTTESYSIFSLTEQKDEKDAQSVMPTNFYFGCNNQNPCFLPAETGSSTFKLSNSVGSESRDIGIITIPGDHSLHQEKDTEASTEAEQPKENEASEMINVAVNDSQVVGRTDAEHCLLSDAQSDLKLPEVRNENIQPIQEPANETADVKSTPDMCDISAESSDDQMNEVDSEHIQNKDTQKSEVRESEELPKSSGDAIEFKSEEINVNETEMKMNTESGTIVKDEVLEEPIDATETNNVNEKPTDVTSESKNVGEETIEIKNEVTIIHSTECNIELKSAPQTELVPDNVPMQQVEQPVSGEPKHESIAPQDLNIDLPEPVLVPSKEYCEVQIEATKQAEEPILDPKPEAVREKLAEVEKTPEKVSKDDSNKFNIVQELKKENKTPSKRGRPKKKPEEESTEDQIVTRRGKSKKNEEEQKETVSTSPSESKQESKKGKKNTESETEKEAVDVKMDDKAEECEKLVGKGETENAEAEKQESTGEDENKEEKEDDHVTDEDVALGVRASKRGRKKRRSLGKKPAAKKPTIKSKEDEEDDGSANDSKKDTKEKKVSSEQTDGSPKKKRGWLTYVDESNIQPASSTGVRQSRRIAQMKIKEQTQTKSVEKTNAKKAATPIQKSKVALSTKKTPKSGKKATPYTPQGEEEPEEETYYEKSRKKKKKKSVDKKMKKKFDPRKAWKHSSGSSSEEEEEEEEEDHYEEEFDEVAVNDASDHEFSPESDIEDEEYTPVKRARTAHSKPKVERDECCQSCGKADQPDWILLCDNCDEGWHAACLKPPVMAIPEGDWFCPPCNHIKLIGGLQRFLKSYDSAKKKKANEDLRRKRLEYVGISLANMIKEQPKGKVEVKQKSRHSEESSESEESSSEEDEPLYQLRVRRQTNLRNRLNEYEELMNSAILRETNADHVEEAAPNPNANATNCAPENQNTLSAVVDAGKACESQIENVKAKPKEENDISNDDSIRDENDDASREENEEGEQTESKPRAFFLGMKNARKKAARLTNLDASSEDDHYSDEDFKGSSVEEPDDDDTGKSDSGSDDSAYREPIRRSTRARRQRYDKDFINDDDSEEKEQGESGSNQRKKRKRGSRYSGSDSEDDFTWGRKKRNKNNQSFQSSFSKKRKRVTMDSDTDDNKSKKRNSRIKYGLDEDEDEDYYPQRRTRGKKINYIDSAASDSEEEESSNPNTKKGLKIISDDEYIEDEQEGSKASSASEDDADQSGSEANKIDSVRRRGLESDESDESDPSSQDPAKDKQTASEKSVADELVSEPPHPRPPVSTINSSRSTADQKPATASAIPTDFSKHAEDQLPPPVPPVVSIDPATLTQDRKSVINEGRRPAKVAVDAHQPLQKQQDANASLQGLQSMTHNLAQSKNINQYPSPSADHTVASRIPEHADHYVESTPLPYPSEGNPPRPDLPYPHPPRAVYGMGVMPAGASGQPPMRYMHPTISPTAGLNVPANNNMIVNRLMAPIASIPGGPMSMTGPIPGSMPVQLSQLPPQPTDPATMNLVISNVSSSATTSPKRRPRGRGKKQLEMERQQREREALEGNRNEGHPSGEVLPNPSAMPPTTYPSYQQPSFPQIPPAQTPQALVATPPTSGSPVAPLSTPKRVKITPTRMRTEARASGPGPDMKIIRCPPRNPYGPQLPPPVTSTGPTDSNTVPVPVSAAAKVSPAKPDGKMPAVGIGKSEPSEQYYHQPPFIANQMPPRGYNRGPEFVFAARKPTAGMYPLSHTTSTAPVVVVSRTGGFSNAGLTPVTSSNVQTESKMTVTHTPPSSVPQSYPSQYPTPHRMLTVTSSPVLHIKPTQSSNSTPPYPAPYYTTPPYAPPLTTSQPPVRFSQANFPNPMTAHRQSLQQNAFKTSPAAGQPGMNSNSGNFMISTSQSGEFGYEENQPVAASENTSISQFKGTFKSLSPSYEEDNRPAEETSSGEFGGLVSYFSSQREDDLDA